jgi:hypothetical protein
MSPKITIKEDYILIEPRPGADFREIQKGLARLFYVKGIPEQNRIWVFREGPRKMSYDDVQKLKDVIKENYPKNSRINKTALVDESGFLLDLAEKFVRIADDVPQTFKVFSNFTDAEEWVKK